jgi:hypothetical protein
MSEKSDDESVLGSLPATRQTRFGRERRETGGGAATKARPKATKPRAAKPKATKAAAKPKPAAKPRATARPRPQPAPDHGPRAVRPGNASLAESTERARTHEVPRPSSTHPPSGTELVTTAIQAAGELAQIGLAVGGQVLRRAVDKLPKP